MDQKQKKMKRLLEARQNLQYKIKMAETQEKRERLKNAKLAVQRTLMNKYDTDVNNEKFMANINVHYKNLPKDVKKEIRMKFLNGIKKYYSGIYDQALEWIDHLEEPTVSPPNTKKVFFYVIVSMICLGIVVYNYFTTCKSYELVRGLFGNRYWEQHTNDTCVRWKNQITMIGSALALLVNLFAFIGDDFVHFFGQFTERPGDKASKMLTLLTFYIISFISVFYISQVKANEIGIMEAAFFGHKLSRFLSNREYMTAIATAYGALGLPTLKDIITSNKEYVRGTPDRGVVHVIPDNEF